jgi:hypothetical protein
MLSWVGDTPIPERDEKIVVATAWQSPFASDYFYTRIAIMRYRMERLGIK